MTFSELGRTIAGKREALGISREELAGRLGVKPKTVEKWEAGKKAPRFRQLAPLGQALGVPAEELLPGGDGDGADRLKGYSAAEKRARSGLDILYLLQDMREFELYGTVRAVVSVCDSMNYILTYEDLVQVLRLVNNYLDPGGILIFDMNTLYKYEEILGENTFAENRPEGSFIWENYFDEETGINEYDLTLFIRDQEEGDLYRKFEETHYQRAYRLSEVRRAVEEAGMEFLTSYDAGTREPVREDSQRIYIIAREKGKMRRE